MVVLHRFAGSICVAAQRLRIRAVGVPAVYGVNGREFVLLDVSGGNPFPAASRLAPGGVNPPAISKSYIAFALPETNRP